MPLLSRDAEEHYRSLQLRKENAGIVECMKNKYGKGRVSKEICPKRSKKFKCLSVRIYDDEGGVIQYNADDRFTCADVL